jgi:hypothetical protein
MLNLIKWNAVDFLRRNYWVFVAMAASLLLALLPANGQGYLNAIAITLSQIIGVIAFQAGVVLAAALCFRWLENESNLLELSLPASSWKILLGKLVMAFLVNTLSCLFLMQFFVFTGKYSTGLVRLLSIENLKSVLVLVLGLMLVDCTILFSYLAAKSFRLTRRILLISTSVLSFVILGAAIAVVGLVMTVSGALILPTISAKDIITINGPFNILSTTAPVCASLAVILLEYAGSSLLLDRRFQPD